MSVFANGLAIAGKAKPGKSIACFPDVCYSPPSPRSGWVATAYANTSKASDTSNGSKTVFIEGKPVMQKDKSFFSTSTGNEGAAGPKGVSTGVKKGKAYFTSWSMNVKVEGYNVCRHSDLMTHNHGSTGNTGPWNYADTSFFSKHDCKGMIKEMNRACAPNNRRPQCKSCDPGYNKDWKKDHCKFLTFKPDNMGSLENPEQLLQDLKDEIAQTDVMEAAIDAAMNKALDWALNKLIILGVKAVGTKVVPVIGWIYTAATISGDIADAKYYQAMYDGAIKEADRIKESIQSVRQEIEAAIESLQNGNLSTAADTIADWQRNAATLNECTRARKCMLVSYGSTDKKSGGLNNQKGCCPGQTGHHLIPKSFVEGAGCKNKKGRAVTEGNAPVVCAEGLSHSYGGSHASMHIITNELIVPREHWGTRQTSKASYSKVRDAVIKAHAKAFPFSTCPRRCLKEQLDNAYQDCNDLTVQQIGGAPEDTSTGPTF